jgi:hypothetical protein
MSNTATLTRDEAPTRDPMWQPMSTAPRNGLILLKVTVEGKSWPVIGQFSFTHGAFCTPPIFGLNEVALYPSAWAEIPAYDNGAHV